MPADKIFHALDGPPRWRRRRNNSLERKIPRQQIRQPFDHAVRRLPDRDHAHFPQRVQVHVRVFEAQYRPR